MMNLMFTYQRIKSNVSEERYEMSKLSKFEAYKLAKRQGVKFNKDFHAQSKGNELAAIAKLTGYRKPKSASGSTGRYFFYHLLRLKEKRGWK